MVIEVPWLAELAVYAAAHPVLVVVLILLFGVVLPAAWSSRASRRCASAAVLGQLLLTARIITVAVALVVVRAFPVWRSTTA